MDVELGPIGYQSSPYNMGNNQEELHKSFMGFQNN